jgi:hypothetical protein
MKVHKSLITNRIAGFLQFFPSSGVLASRNTTFRKLDLFPSSYWGGGKTPTQLGPLERANHNPPFTCGRKQIQFPKRHVSTPKNTGRRKKPQNPAILCAIHHRQNPIKSTYYKITKKYCLWICIPSAQFWTYLQSSNCLSFPVCI